jgi:hypothetical protein
MRFTRTTIGALALAAITLPLGAQNDRAERERATAERARAWAWSSSDDDEERAMLGVSTGSGGERDTLGLLITSVTPNGPAEKAGLEEGHRIAEINGTSLRLSRADAGEPDMNGMMSRRLTREMRKLKAGAVVTLKVYQDGSFRDVRVTTVAAEELRPRRVRMTREDMEDRAVIGVSASATGSDRDTLGIMVQSVAEDGPAEKAGIFEGARIQSINGVNLRVPAADAGDHAFAGTRSNRFSREMAKVKAGDEVELRVYSNGETRTVRVRAARSGDVYKNTGGRFFFGDAGGMLVPPMPPIPPMAPMPRVQVSPRVYQYRGPGVWELNLERDVERAVEGALAGVRAIDLEGLKERLEEIGEGIGEAFDDVEVRIDDDEPVRAPVRRLEGRTPQAIPAPAPAARDASFMVKTSWSPGRTPAMAPAVVSSPRSSAPRGLSLPGLRASVMDADLAAYFGEEDSIGDGLLVIEADERWDELRVGDVIVEVNGRRVRGDARSVCLDRTKDNRLTVVRKGKRETLVVRAV